MKVSRLLLVPLGCLGTLLALGSLTKEKDTLAEIREKEKDTLAEVRESATFLARSPCVAFSPDGKVVAASAEGGFLVLWDAATGKEQLRLQRKGGTLSGLVFSPDGKVVAAALGHDKVKLWDAVTGKELDPLEGQTGFVHAVAFSHDGKIIASGNVEGTIRVYNLETRKEQTVFRTRGGVRSLKFSPDRKTLASADNAGQVRLWDVNGGKELRSFKATGGEVLYLAYAPDGKTVVTNTMHGSPQLWDSETGEEKATIPGLPGQVQFSPDGKLLAAGKAREGVVELRDASTLKVMAVWTAHQEAVLDLAFSPDSNVLVTVGRDRTGRLWDVAKILGQKPPR